jgi:tetratricopeptide (TPR) repeat protein
MFRYFLLLLLSFFLFFNYYTFKSLIGQRLIAEDVNESISLDSLNDILPFFPNLGLSSTPIDMHRAIYNIKYGNYDESKQLIKKANKINPYTYVGEYLYARLYLAEDKLDSALYYSFRSFYKWPKNPQHYKTYNEVLVKLKDSVSLINAFKFLDSSRQINPIYRDDYLKSYNEIKIKYLINDFDDKIPVTKNNIVGTWVRSYFFGDKEIVSDTTLKYIFNSKSFINPSGHKYDFKLVNDSLLIFSQSKPNIPLQSINLYYSPKANALFFNNVEFEAGKFQNQFFKKID